MNNVNFHCPKQHNSTCKVLEFYIFLIFHIAILCNSFKFVLNTFEFILIKMFKFGQIWSFWDLVLYVLGMGISTVIDITCYFTYLGVYPNLTAGIKIPKFSAHTFFQDTKFQLSIINSEGVLGQWPWSFFDRQRSMSPQVALKFQNHL